MTSLTPLRRLLPEPLKRPLRRARRALCERVGVDRYSRPSLHGQERALAPYVPERDGFFIEVGAFDGYNQSNTYWLEKMRGWRGLLVEPLPDMARECRKNRPASRVVQAALVGPQGPFELRFRDVRLMSGIAGRPDEDASIARGLRAQQLSAAPEIVVRGRTLTDILDEDPPARIDLFSLDVEGSESAALAGLDLERYRPRVILLETNPERPAEAVLVDAGYERVCQLNPHDALFRDTRPPTPPTPPTPRARGRGR